MRCLLALLFVFAVSACTRLEHPIVGTEGPGLDPALVGEWEFTNEKGSMRLAIRPDGDAGALVMTTNEEGEETKVEHFRLITARLEQRSYASVQSNEPDDDAKGAWAYCPYELPTPDVLIVRRANDEAWTDAVRNGQLAGQIEKKTSGTSVTVTESGAELRAFVLGYGSVIFSDEILAEFRRVK